MQHKNQTPLLFLPFFLVQKKSGRGAELQLNCQAAIGRELRRTCSPAPPAACEFRPSQQARASAKTDLPSRQNRTAAAMKQRASLLVWLQVVAACLVLGVTGEFPVFLRGSLVAVKVAR